MHIYTYIYIYNRPYALKLQIFAQQLQTQKQITLVKQLKERFVFTYIFDQVACE